MSSYTFPDYQMVLQTGISCAKWKTRLISIIFWSENEHFPSFYITVGTVFSYTFLHIKWFSNLKYYLPNGTVDWFWKFYGVKIIFNLHLSNITLKDNVFLHLPCISNGSLQPYHPPLPFPLHPLSTPTPTPLQPHPTPPLPLPLPAPKGKILSSCTFPTYQMILSGHNPPTPTTPTTGFTTVHLLSPL